MSTVLVTTRDGIVFRVETDPRAAVFERLFASRLTADQLELHEDFARVRSLDDLVSPAPAVLLLTAPTPSLTPTERRATFRLVMGGKS